MKNGIIEIKLLQIFILCFIINMSAAAQMEIRMWQVLSLDTSYTFNVLKEAEEYDVNTLLLSHGAISYTMELYEEKYEPKTLSEQGKQLKAIAKAADAKNIDTYIWIHELGDIPPKFLKDEKVDFDNPKFWDYMENRYNSVFKDYPEFDGIQLTFHETHFKVFDSSDVISSLPMPKRFYKLINTVHQICKEYDKKLIVRTFLYTPQEYAWMQEGLAMLDDDLIIENKYVPNDWQPFFPNNRLIADVKEKQQIIEFDASAEYQGRNYFPWCAVDHFKERLNYAQQFNNVIGYNVRLNHGGYDALFNPNSVSIYSLAKIAEKPDATADEIWREWAVMKYGDKEADAVIEILKPTYDIVNMLYFPQKVWFGNHSKLTHFEYGLRMIPYIADWDPSYQPVVDELLNPTEETLLRIIAEKDTMLAMIQVCQWKIYENRDILSKETYDDLTERFLFLHQFGMLSKSNAKLFWGVLLAQKDKSYIPYVKKELEVFRMMAKMIPQQQIDRKNNWLLDPLVVEKVAKSIEKQLPKN